MKYLILISVLLLSAQSQAVVYGEDNRIDLYENTNPLFNKLATGIAAMVPTEQVKMSANPKIYNLIKTESLEKRFNVCPSEAFAKQKAVAACSGFLVGPDTIVTAGHCYSMLDTPVNVCKNNVWIFDYNMKSPSAQPNRNIPARNVYRCKQVFTSQFKDQDFSVIKLDRPVEGREPLKYKTRGMVTPSTRLVVMGHPSGLPLKISDGGRVVRNRDKNRFSTNLDTFHVNSGSAVFDAVKGEIVGILIEGQTDYVPSIQNDPESCQVINRCDAYGRCENGKIKGPQQWGEIVMKIEVIAETITKGVRSK